MASVQLRNVTKAWGDVVVSKDINLDITEGEFAVSYTHLTLPTNREV